MSNPHARGGGENYFDIIAQTPELVADAVGPEVKYFHVGGGASAALMDPATIVDRDSRSIIPPKGIYKPQFRHNNGTRTDDDQLVMSTDLDVVKAVRDAQLPILGLLRSGTPEQQKLEKSKPGAKLKIGVTGLTPAEEYFAPPKSIISKFVHGVFISERLEAEDGQKSFAISDIEVKLPEDYFEPWQLILSSGKAVPVLNPMIQVMCYMSRTSHGIRGRDTDKVQAIVDNFGQDFNARLRWGHQRQAAELVFGEDANPGLLAAADFVRQKNALRYNQTKHRMGKPAAGLLAAEIALHRRVDSAEALQRLGQQGWLYDHVLSKFSREQQ